MRQLITNIKMDPLTAEEISFISDNASASPAGLRLRYTGKSMPVRTDLVITQIESRQKSAAKLRNALAFPEFIFPSTLLAEQSTDEAVASYHASLFRSEENVADLTAGLGIDSFAISRRVRTVTAVEMDKLSAEALAMNAATLGIGNLNVVNAECIDYLLREDRIFDAAFIDPARRGDGGRKVHALSQCSPDVAKNLGLILNRCRRLTVKASPMLDISEAARQLPGLTEAVAVSLRGECKELLLTVDPRRSGLRTGAVIIGGDGQWRSIFPAAENGNGGRPPIYEDDTPLVGSYLYEPDAAVMKIGAPGAIHSLYPEMRMLAPDTMLFISAEEIAGFPGRVMRILDTGKTKSRQWSRLKGEKRNVAVRNFPLDAPSLAKMLKTSDGGDIFIYGCRIGRRGTPALIEAVRI